MTIRRLAISTAGIEAACDFYGQTLGLPQVDVSVFAVGGTPLELRQAEAEQDPNYHLAFDVPSNLFHEAKAWLAERVDLLLIDGKDEVFYDFWNAHACYFGDPVGNVLELIAHHVEEVERLGPFTPELFLGIAEVGLPVPDVGAAVAELSETLGLEIWDGRGVRPEGITPLGWRHGSFVVVRRGRRWFPTDVSSACYPLEAVLETARSTTWRPAELPYVIHGEPE